MQDAKKLGEPETPATPVEDEPQKGGFGALADVCPRALGRDPPEHAPA